MTRIGGIEVPPSVSLLGAAVRAGVFGPTEVHLCAAVRRLVPAVGDDALLALALCSRATRHGHSCIDLAEAPDVVDADGVPLTTIQWPDPDPWLDHLRSSPIVTVANGTDSGSARRPLVLDGRLLYLDRYWNYEQAVAQAVLDRVEPTTQAATGADPAVLDAALEDLFGQSDADEPDLQREAARIGVTRAVSIIAGGPGTGKTRTIARMLAVLYRVTADAPAPLDIALCAPTGKAAQRMTEALHREVAAAERDGLLEPDVAARLRAVEAVTMHALLGANPVRGFARDRRNPLPHDLVVVDEMSMVSLSLMAHCFDALRPSARLVLVGDPDQLVSIDTGSVAGDLVDAAAAPGARLRDCTTVLRRARRFGGASPVAALADAVRSGDADRVLDVLENSGDDLRWIRPDDSRAVGALEAAVVEDAAQAVEGALAGDADAALAALLRTKVLGATRHHRFGVHDWNDRIDRAVTERFPDRPGRFHWPVGRPVIIGRNDTVNRVRNGDVGIVVEGPDGPLVAMADGGEHRLLAPARLGLVDTWWAMTIHKSQGSEFDHVVVSIPDLATTLLTRELLYTAVTRARQCVSVCASEAALRAAVDRRVTRASGLAARLAR